MIPDPVPRCSHCRTRTDDLYRTVWGDLCDRCVTLQEEHDAYAAATGPLVHTETTAHGRP